MPKLQVSIPEAEYEIMTKIAHKLGLTTKALIQQEIDQAVTTMSAWLQRADLVQ